jgi:hypothetical protein
MALAPCRECGAEISTEAKTCPKCGVTLKRKRRIWPWVLASPFIAFGALLAIGAMSGLPSEKSRARSAIALCWDEQGKKSNSAGGAQFIAGACERMEQDFRARFNANP